MRSNLPACVSLLDASGHPGGAEEGKAVENWASAFAAEEFNVWRSRQLNRPPTAPYLVLVEKAPA